VEIRPHCLTRRLYRRLAALENVGRRLLTDIDKPQERMQITSVRYRELVSLRGCERKALEAEATVGPGEPPEHACCSLLSLPFVPMKQS
jgi:hypothetical protein